MRAFRSAAELIAATTTRTQAAAYSIDASLLTIRLPPAPEGNGCVSRYPVETVGDGTLYVGIPNSTDPACEPQKLAVPGSETWTRLTPSSSGTGLYQILTPGPESPVTAATQLTGGWMAPETHALLVIAPDGPDIAYRLDTSGHIDTVPDDYGTVTMTGEGQIDLTTANPANSNRGCADTRLGHGIIRSLNTLSLDVLADPCHYLAGASHDWGRGLN